MKQTIFALILSTLFMGSAWGDRVGVSIHLGHPNFFGEIDLGDLAPPPVIRERPILIKRARHSERLAPIYLRVPERHARNWSRYCYRYNACSRPVYFVKDDWYTSEYVPRYRERHDEDHRDEGRDQHHDAGNGHDRRHRDHDDDNAQRHDRQDH